MAPKIVDREERRRALAVAATEVFAEKGYAGARIVDVAERAGVGKGTVYEYFRSKEELFFAVFELMCHEEHARLGAVMGQDAPAVERLGSLVRSLVADAVGQVELYGVTFELWSGCSHEVYGERLRTAFADLYRDFRGHLAELIREGQAAGEIRAGLDPQGLAAAVVGAIDALGLQYWVDRTVDVVSAAETFVEALRAGIEP